MSESYAKLFSTITASTIWGEPLATRCVWITMLAIADRAGVVQASIPGLARLANVTLAECEGALAILLAPDKYSRTPDHEGRRIAAVDGGWCLLNHAKYRKKLDAEDRRERKRAWMAEHRAEVKTTVDDEDHAGPRESTGCPQTAECGPGGHITDTAADAPVEQEPKKKRRPQASADAARMFDPPAWFDETDRAAWAGYIEMRIAGKKTPTAHACKLAVDELAKLDAQGFKAAAVLNQSTRNGWTDVYPIKTPGVINGSHRESAADRAERLAREGDEREARQHRLHD